MCVECSDETGCAVSKQLGGVHDLVAEAARYHDECWKKFYAQQTKFGPHTGTGESGRPESKEVLEEMNKIYERLEESNDCQFTLADLTDGLTFCAVPNDHQEEGIWEIWQRHTNYS